MDDSPMPTSFDDDPDFFEEGRWHKFVRKLKEEPLIPLGCGVTCWALYNAGKNIRKGGDSNQTNRYFRYRLYAQAFTITAMLAGSFYYNADRFKRAEFQKLKKKQKEQEKREKWIRELEARDAEDKEWRARLGKIRNAEREAEEIRMVAEKKAMTRAGQAKAEGRDDDNRGVIEAIRLQNNAARAAKYSTQGADGRQRETAAADRVTDSVRRASEKQAAAERERMEKYRPILGESEQGGLFGIGHLKSFWSYLTKKSDGGEKEDSSE